MSIFKQLKDTQSVLIYKNINKNALVVTLTEQQKVKEKTITRNICLKVLETAEIDVVLITLQTMINQMNKESE